MNARPICIDLFCGLGGWAEGFLAEGYDVIGFDIERHDYGTGGYPAQLVLQDVLTLHGSQFRNAACIVASPPCQEFSYSGMPWKRTKAQVPAVLPEWWKKAEKKMTEAEFAEWVKWRTEHPAKAPDTALFDACFRIQREASEAAGHHIPMVVENVCKAQRWVGRAKWHFGSYYLWGDVPPLMPSTRAQKIPKYSDPRRNGAKGAHLTCSMENERRMCICPGTCDCQNPEPEGDLSGTGAIAHFSMNCPVHNLYPDPVPECPASIHCNGARDGIKVPSMNFHDHEKTGKPGRSFQSAAVTSIKNGGDWFSSGAGCSLQRRASSHSKARKVASAMIAKIPFALANWVARVYKPEGVAA